MSFLTSLLGSEHIERFIPLATGKAPDSGLSATVEQPRIRAVTKAAPNQGSTGAAPASAKATQTSATHKSSTGSHKRPTRSRTPPVAAPAPQPAARPAAAPASQSTPHAHGRDDAAGDRRCGSHARVGPRMAGARRTDRPDGRSPVRDRDLENPARVSRRHPRPVASHGLIASIAVVTPSRGLRYLRGSPEDCRLKERTTHEVFPFVRNCSAHDHVPVRRRRRRPTARRRRASRRSSTASRCTR